MCGIAGFADFSNTSSRDILVEMTDTLKHRGPDGKGYELLEGLQIQVGLGHRRLSIIDLTSAGSQPMRYQDLHITYNGEIYNHREIRVILESLGHQFESNSDTEVILHAYAQWGAACLHRFIGMFAFVIYDEAQQKIFACRDRAGIKPFFYYWHDGLFLFGSELKALVKHPFFKKQLNRDAVAAFLQFGYVPTPHCIYTNCHKINPGHYLELCLRKKNIQATQYWNVYDAYNQSPATIYFPEAMEETERILTNAFQYRMVSDVPVGVFLSGGYDSTCVTALLQKNSTQKIRTFTIGVSDTGLNEAPFAKEIAAHLGTEHTEAYCTTKEAAAIIPELSFYYDEPFADSSAIPTTLVSKIAREKVTVALSADAGDEIFAGYNRYDYLVKYGRRIGQVPDFMRRGAAALMDRIPAQRVPYLNKQYLFQSRYEKVKSLLKNTTGNHLLLFTQAMNDKEVAAMFSQPVGHLSSAFDSLELKDEYFGALPQAMAIDYETYLLDDILQKVDRATMSQGLEGREPFLDHRIIEWAASLPMQYKYNKGEKKYILKEIVHKYVPKEIMNRPKMGFGIPLGAWLSSELKDLVMYYLGEEFLRKQNIFNLEQIDTLKKAFYNGKTERAEKIWYLLMFQMWYDRWMNHN